MPPFEQRLQQRFPHWFGGRRERIARPLLRTLRQWSRLERVEAFLGRSAHLRDFAFIDATLDHLRFRYQVDACELASIPAAGRLLIVANHPSGALDALALLHAVGRVRRDVRIVANDLLSLIEPLAALLLPVRILGGRANPGSLRAIGRALEDGQCVIVFPAGEVSRLGLRGLRDSRWRGGFLHLARTTGAPVLPVRIAARNSALFYGASALYKPAATALLAREMYARRSQPLRLHVGQPFHIDPGEDPRIALRSVRRTVYALGKRDKVAQPLVPAIDPATLAIAIAGTELLGRTGDGKQIRLARVRAGAPLLQELGRLRELTFRQVGEGTGRNCDVDAYDTDYEQIVVWDEANARIAGGYRVAPGARLLARHGLAGLYTASLFRYADEALPRIAQGLELGRSFVVPDYWGSRSLDYLWQGIGIYLLRHPGVRYLFGAVSLSAALPWPARDQLVAYYQRYYGCEGGLAESLRPFRYFAAPPCFGALDAETAFGVLKANLAAIGASVPMLYRQYTDLCDPGGARFLAFGVDPGFSNSIDGLIEIDLERIRPGKRQRYLRPGKMLA